MKKTLFLLFFSSVALLHAEILKDDTFRTQLNNWNTPAYWNGKVSRERKEKQGFLSLESTEKNGQTFARSLSFSKQIDLYPEYKIRMTVRVEGAGTFLAGLLFYDRDSGSPTYMPGEKIQLTGEPRQYETSIVLAKVPRMVLPYLEINGKGNALVESFRMETVAENNASIVSATPLQIVKSPEELSTAVFETSMKDREIRLFQKNKNLLTEKKAKTDASGKVVFEPEKKGSGIVFLTASAGGTSANSYADIMSPAEYAATDELAKKIRLGKKIHALVIGDSLSDFYRGRNYVDMLNFWLNKYNPGKFSFRNAGVGGDFLTRVEARLNGMTNGKKAYRQEMYDCLFKESYDLIFIFLGQNDTYVTRSKNFDNPRVAPTEQEVVLRRVLDMLGKNSKAKIVLISPSPSNEKLFLDRLASLKDGVEMGMFGARKHVEAFDAVNRKVCADRKLDYIDILNPMRRTPDLKALYVEDGVHLSNEGAQLISREILRWFAGGKL